MKKVISLILSLVMIITIVSSVNITAFAADGNVENAVQWAISTANDNTHGYQYGAKGPVNYDCSSFVSSAFINAGFNVPQSTTADMRRNFTSRGFTAYSRSSVSLQRGDILLKSGHVELYIGNNQCVGAHNNYDGKSGDSSGREIQVRTRGTGCYACKIILLFLDIRVSSHRVVLLLQSRVAVPFRLVCLTIKQPNLW